jgi:hypothetical protein
VGRSDHQLSVGFASGWDEACALAGPPAVFLLSREGALKLEVGWTRDAWSRRPGPHAFAWTWTLCRDRATGYVVLALATSPSLLQDHPRMDVRVYADEADARDALAALGAVPSDPSPWC